MGAEIPHNRPKTHWFKHFRAKFGLYQPQSESAPKRPKTQQSAGKVMASVFWDAQGVIFIYYLEKGKTITEEA